MREEDRQKELKERGREACRVLGNTARGARRHYFPKREPRLPDDWPRTLGDLLIMGYRRFMRDCEQRILDDARRRIAESRPEHRRMFLRIVENALAHESDPNVVAGLRLEQRKVQRALGIKPSAETIREQTRERVRRHRKRLASRAQD